MVWPDIRPFSISGRIPDIETIRIPDIWLIFNAVYPVIRPDIQYPIKKVSGPTLISISRGRGDIGMYTILVPTDFADMVLLYSERDRGGKFTN